MGETLTDILRLLELEPLGSDVFDGPQPGGPNSGRIFGGQVAAQALVAAGLTAGGRPPHSLHLYFLRMGDPQAPLKYSVTTLRDGRTFSARAVQVTQNDDRVILEALASFTEPAGAVDYQTAMPDVPAPETLPPMEAICRTSVAVIGRTDTEAGTNTVCTSGAMLSFIPAICIS